MHRLEESPYARIPIDHDRLGPGRVVEPVHVRRAKWLTIATLLAVVLLTAAWSFL